MPLYSGCDILDANTSRGCDSTILSLSLSQMKASGSSSVYFSPSCWPRYRSSDLHGMQKGHKGPFVYVCF